MLYPLLAPIVGTVTINVSVGMMNKPLNHTLRNSTQWGYNGSGWHFCLFWGIPAPQYLITSYSRIYNMNILLLTLGFVLGIAVMYWGG
jgi:hypothetical protein